MGILFHCPDCERPLNVGSQFAGKPGICPNCRSSISVPIDSEIVKAEYQTRLNAWSRRQTESDANPEEIDFVPCDSGQPVLSRNSERSTKTRSNSPAVVAPVVTVKPIDVGGIAAVATESQIVGDGLSARFSAGAPNLLEDNGQAVWFVRPPSGGQFGPASAKLLRHWIQEGRITGDSYVWCEGWDNWQNAGEVFPEIASKVSIDSITSVNSDEVTATKTRTAYIKARQRRTMRNVIGLIVGTVVVIALIVVLLVIVRNQGA